MTTLRTGTELVWKSGDSCVWRGKFGTIRLIQRSSAYVDFDDNNAHSVPLADLEVPDRAPRLGYSGAQHLETPRAPVAVPEASQSPETGVVSAPPPPSGRALRQQALADDPGPPFKCRYEGCEDEALSRQIRAGHERFAHGKAYKAGEQDSVPPAERPLTKVDLEAAYQRGRLDAAAEIVARVLEVQAQMAETGTAPQA